MTEPNRRQDQRRVSDMQDSELWRTLGELEASAKASDASLARLFALIGEVKDSLAGLQSTISAHVGGVAAREANITQLGQRVQKLEDFRDHGLMLIGGCTAVSGALGALIQNISSKWFGGH